MLVRTNASKFRCLSRKCSRQFSQCLRPNQDEPTRPRTSDATERESVQDHGTTRPRAYGHRALPLPPTMNSAITKAKSRYKRPKPKQRFEDLTEFQKDLSANPYARALATPVRLCAFTSVKLPSHFLMPFVTQFRPLQSPKAATKDDGKDETRLAPHLIPRDVTSHAGPSVYALNSQALLRRLSKKRGWHRLASRDMADKYKIRDKKDWTWDDTTDRQALSSMRRTLVGKLKWSFKMPNAKLVRPLDDTETESRRAACILQLRSRSDLPRAPGDPNVAPDESTKGHSGGPLPLFYLPELLGDEATNVLVEGTRFATSDAVVLASSYLTASTHVELLKLQAFLGRIEK